MPEGRSGKPIIVTTIGFMCIGFVAWMSNLHAAGWLAEWSGYASVTLLTLGSALLGLMALLAFFSERTLDSIIFFAYAGYKWSLRSSFHVHITRGADSWFLLLWAVVFFYIWLGSFRGEWARKLFLLTAWLALLACAVPDWTHGATAQVFVHVRGYLGLVSGAVALLISARSAMGHDRSAAQLLELR